VLSPAGEPSRIRLDVPILMTMTPLLGRLVSAMVLVGGGESNGDEGGDWWKMRG